MVLDPYGDLAADTTQTSNDTEAIASGLRRLWAGIVRGMRQGESVGGLHLQQFWVLVLTRNGPMRMSEIAEALETSQANVTGLIDRLERAGFVRRVRSESDRRVVEVSITQQGLEMIGRMRSEYQARVDHALRNLDAAERSQLLALITKALDGGA